MTLSLSRYLEILRVFAVLIVFVGHSKFAYAPLGDLLTPYGFGRDGVIVFFVLSGYVISWCADKRDRRLSDFAVQRTARIYSVAIPALILSMFSAYALYWIGSIDLPYQFDKLYVYLPMYLTFTGHTWSLFENPPLNFPYWSLYYEVWFYVMFGLYFYLRGARRWLLIALSALVAGPAILMWFPLWLLGSAIYFGIERIKLGENAARLLLACSVLGLVLLKIFQIDDVLDRLFLEHLLRPQADMAAVQVVLKAIGGSQQYPGDFAIGFCVGASIVAARYADIAFAGRFCEFLVWLASFSFSFYLYHMPLFELVEQVFSPPHDSLAVYALDLAAVSVLIMALACLTEKKKAAVRAAVRWLFVTFIPRFPAAEAAGAKSHRQRGHAGSA